LLRAQYDAWAWEQPEQQEQILESRKAITHTGLNHLDDVRKCQILYDQPSWFKIRNPRYSQVVGRREKFEGREHAPSSVRRLVNSK